MAAAPKPANEQQRLNALWSHELLDTQPEEAFDSLTRLAANLCGVPIAIVSLVDKDRQWFKAQCGLDGMTSTERDASFCAHAILQEKILEVPDASADPRFADSRLVTGDPKIKFYAGTPLIDSDHMTLGTLCVIDRQPGRLTPQQRQQLAHLAKAIVGLIEMRIRRSEMEAQRLAMLGQARGLVEKRVDRLGALVGLRESIATAGSAEDVLALALAEALRHCENSRGAVVSTPTGTRAPLPASTTAVVSARIRADLGGGNALMLTRDPSHSFTQTERAVLEFIATMAAGALASFAAAALASQLAETARRLAQARAAK